MPITDTLTEAPAARHWSDRATLRLSVRPIQIAVAVSILLHALVLWEWLPKLDIKLPTPENAVLGPLNVVIAPPPRPPAYATSSRLFFKTHVYCPPHIN